MTENNIELQQLQAQQMQEKEDDLDIFAILQYCIVVFLRNLKWYILAVLLCLIVAFFYLKKQQRVYSQYATVLIDSQNGGGKSSSLEALKQLNGVQVTDNLKNEIFVLKSRRLMGLVVDSLNLDVSYSTTVGLTPVSLYQYRPFTVTFLSPYAGYVSFRADVISPNSIKISDMHVGGEAIDFNQEVKYGAEIKTPAGKMKITKADDRNNYVGKTVQVTRTSREGAIGRFAGSIGANIVDDNASLIALSCRDTNVERAKAILGTLLAVYKYDIINSKNSVANNTAKFIDQRIGIIGSELSDVENKLAQYKQANQIVDFSTNAQNYLQQSTAAQQQANQIQTQLSVAKYLSDHVNNASNEKGLIPDLSGLGNTSLQTQIAQYNDLVLQYQRLAENSSSASSVVAEQERNINALQGAIRSSLDNYMNSLKLQLNRAQAIGGQFQGAMAGIPQKEIQALDIGRQQTIKEALYTYLLNKREEVALQLAINEANMRVVEDPYGSTAPISPNSRTAYLIALVIGLLIPTLILWARIQMNTLVRGRKDVEDNLSAPIVGEIPEWVDDENEQKMLTKKDNGKSISEAFRVLRYSLNFVMKDGGVIMLTSSTPSQGKSFISRNLSVILGVAGKKVILVDADIRKNSLTTVVHSQGAGLTAYLSGQATSLDEIINKDLAENLDFIPAGVRPPNPSELLMNEEFDKMIAELRKRYDYVVIDTTPAITVADAGIVNRVADVTLYVIRVGVEDRRFLKQLDQLYRSGKFKGMNVVINGTGSGDHSWLRLWLRLWLWLWPRGKE